jgi:hypothetical protein
MNTVEKNVMKSYSGFRVVREPGVTNIGRTSERTSRAIEVHIEAITKK